jgi:CCR4-NOT transcription complex subunit 1
MAVIGVLAELYHFADLKLNLKFEIEVLCKALEIDLNTVEPGSILRNRPAESGPAGGQEFPVDGEVLQLDPAAAQGLATSIEPLLLALVNSVVISTQLSPLNANPVFKRAVQLAVDRAVREIIVPVVERSVTIAGISTGELVIKDFATEVNENKLRRAGYLMAQKLAGSLALVTCKEPLKTNLGNHLRQHLNEHGFTEVREPELPPNSRY